MDDKEYPVYLTNEQRAKVREAIDKAFIDKGDQSAIELADKFAPVDPFWTKLSEGQQATLRGLIKEEMRDCDAWVPEVDKVLDMMSEDEVKSYIEGEE